MSIAYLTHDEVNAEVARRLARRFALDLAVFGVNAAGLTVAADVLVLDLDHLPPECKSKLFFQAGRGELREGLAVHSYHLTAAEARELRRAGVRTARRLTATILLPRSANTPV